MLCTTWVMLLHQLTLLYLFPANDSYVRAPSIAVQLHKLFFYYFKVDFELPDHLGYSYKQKTAFKTRKFLPFSN